MITKTFVILNRVVFGKRPFIKEPGFKTPVAVSRKMIQGIDGTDLPDRIAAFKSDPEKLRQANEFVDQLILQAKKEAEIKQKEKERSFDSQDANVGNIKRRLGRARGFVLRMFDALCNCTQTAATAARTTVRNNPFAKR